MALEERGVSTVGKGADWMRETLAKHSDFQGREEHGRMHACGGSTHPLRSPQN